MNELRLAGLIGMLFVACRAAPDHRALEEVLRAEAVRCLAVEPRFVLYSPYDAERTQRFVTATNQALDDLEQAFGVGPGAPLVVSLVPKPVEAGTLTVSAAEVSIEGAPDRASDHGVLGIAGRDRGIDVAAVYVPSDRVRQLLGGRQISETFTFAEDLGTLRHELTHLVAERAGLVGAQWLDEGLAQLFEYGRLNQGELVTDRDSPSLVAARDRYAGTSLNLLLPWKEEHAQTVRGLVFHAGRPLAHALAVFIIEGSEGALPQRLRRLAGMEDPELLALEPAFRDWLAADMPLLVK